MMPVAQISRPCMTSYSIKIGGAAYDGRTRYGFIAEDTASVDAHLATYDASGTVSGIDDPTQHCHAVNSIYPACCCPAFGCLTSRGWCTAHEVGARWSGGLFAW